MTTVAPNEFNVASLEACVGLVVALEKALTNRVLANSSSGEPVVPISKKLQKLHSLVVSDGEHCDIAVTLLRTNFFSTISSSALIILRFPALTDDVLRLILPLLRLKQQEIRENVNAQLLSNGGLIFALLALKQHMQQSASIRVQGCEMIAALLDHVTKLHQSATNHTNNPEEEKPQHILNRQHTLKYPANKLLRTVVQDTVHQLLLHGAAATLCRLFTLSVSNMHEISVRRAIGCIMFLLLETPSDLATKVASYEGWSVVKALHTVLKEMSLSARIDAAALLTGLLASDIQVAERIHSLGVWDELSSTLAQNASVINVPKMWLRDSLDKIRLVNDRASTKEGDRRVTHPTPMPALSKREEPVFSYSFGLDGDLGASMETETGGDSLINDKMGFEDIVNALLDTHAAVDVGTKRSPSLGMLSAKHLEAQLQRHVSKAKLAFSGFGEVEDTYLPTNKRPQSASSNKKMGKGVPPEPSYIKNLKTSPLGHPIDPAQYRRELRLNGGQLPEYVPAALGGKALGRRPGAPKDPSESKHVGSKRSGEGKNIHKGKDLPAAGKLIPVPAENKTPQTTKKKKQLQKTGSSLQNINTEQAGTGTVQSNTKATAFVAQRLFEKDGNGNPLTATVVAPRPQTSSAIDRLSFAERLQCMILQVKEKMT